MTYHIDELQNEAQFCSNSDGHTRAVWTVYVGAFEGRYRGSPTSEAARRLDPRNSRQKGLIQTLYENHGPPSLDLPLKLTPTRP